MKKMMIIFSLMIVLSAFCYADGQAGLDIAVLNADVGARALGMGSAYVAVADDVDSPYWNPAGLAHIKNYQITTMQTKLSTDADHYYVSFVMPFMGGGLGLSWIQIGMGSITQTSTVDAFNDVQNLGVFSYYSNAYIASYGANITDKLSFGVTAKYLTSGMPGLVSIEGADAYGYSLTPGIQYKVSDRLMLGLKIDELVNYQKWGTDTEEIAPSITRFGLAYRTSIYNLPLLLSGDVSQINRSGYVPTGSGGAELTFGSIAFRLGVSDSVMTAGAGFAMEHIRIDYAYVTQTNLTTDNVHRVSLTGMW
jgi:hypothetical protein